MRYSLRNVLVGMLVAIFCGSFAFGAGGAEDTSPGVSDDEIVFGYTMPMSGPVGFIGNQTLDAVRAEFNRVNDEGGVHGRNLRVIAYDSGMDVSQAVANYRRLINEDRVFALLFGFGSFVRPAYPLIEQNRIPWFFPMAPPEDMMFPARRYLFSMFPTTATQVTTIAHWLGADADFERIAIVYGDSASGQTGRERFLLEAEERGLNVVAQEAMVETSASAASQIASIRRQNPDLVLIVGMTMQPAAVIIREIRRVGLETDIMLGMPISNSVLLNLIADEEPEGIYGSYWGDVQYEPQFDSLGTPEMQAMAETIIRYYPEYGQPGSNIGGNVEHGLSVRFLVDALEEAGPELTRERLIEVFESYDAVPTGKGSLASFSPTRREGVAGGVIMQVQDGWWTPISDFIDIDLPE